MDYDWTELLCLVIVTAAIFLATIFFFWRTGILRYTNVADGSESEGNVSKEMQSVLHLNVPESAREFLLTRAQTFQRLTFHGKGLTESSDIKSWQSKNTALLRQYLQELTVDGRIHFETALTECTRDFILQMQDAISEPRELSDMLQDCLASLACKIAFGKSYDTELLLKTRLEKFLKSWPDWSILSSTPLQRSEMTDKMGFDSAKEKLQSLLKEIICEKKKEWNGCEKDSFVDYYFYHSNPEEKENDYTFLTNHVAGLFFCFSDSLSKALLSSLEFLTNYTDVQEKVRGELNAVSVNENLITLWLDQRERVPLMEAFLYEVLRLSAVVPRLMMIGGSDTEDDTAEAVAVNFSSVLLDQKHWENPNEFRPARFIQSGELKVQDAFIPFSVGTHSCPGQRLTLVTCFVVLSSIMRKFSVTKRTPPADGGKENTEPQGASFHICDLTESNFAKEE